MSEIEEWKKNMERNANVKNVLNSEPKYVSKVIKPIYKKLLKELRKRDGTFKKEFYFESLDDLSKILEKISGTNGDELLQYFFQPAKLEKHNNLGKCLLNWVDGLIFSHLEYYNRWYWSSCHATDLIPKGDKWLLKFYSVSTGHGFDV